MFGNLWIVMQMRLLSGCCRGLLVFNARWGLDDAIAFELGFSGAVAWKDLCLRMQREWGFGATQDEVLAAIPTNCLSKHDNLVRWQGGT